MHVPWAPQIMSVIILTAVSVLFELGVLCEFARDVILATAAMRRRRW
jgi:hypothetical protein